MPRKGENIYKRKDGRWEGRYIKARCGKKIKYGYVYAKTYSGVKQLLHEKRIALTKIETEQLTGEKDFVTLSDVAERWLQETTKTAKESTLVKYRNAITKYVLPEIGNYKIHMLAQSPCYRANISVLTNDSLSGDILVNAAIGEAIDKGNCDFIHCKVGQYGFFNGQFVEYATILPDSLKFWPTLFSLEEINSFFRYPALYDGEYIEMRKETMPVLGAEGLKLGTTSQGHGVNIETKSFKAFQSLGADLNHFFFKILFFLLALHILTPFPFRILAERLSQSHIRLR